MPSEKQKQKRRLKQLKFREKIRVADHEIWQKGHPTDIIIPIMGPTGVGKSTFVNTLMRRDVVCVGHELDSCTVKLQPIVVDKDEPRLVIVDTPGFDDTYTDDSEILRRIAVWLGNAYGEGMTLGGVLYLHDITQTRMLGTTRKNLDMFRKLCGDDALPSVALVTTKWNDVPDSTGKKREQQLREKHWKEMFERGSEITRFEGTSESARRIINTIKGKKKKPDHIQIQNELVELTKVIPATDAGKQLRGTLEEFISMAKKSGSDDPEQKAQMEKIQQEIQRLAAEMGGGGPFQRFLSIFRHR